MAGVCSYHNEYVSIELEDSEKFLTLIPAGGVMAIRIDTRGRVIGAVSDALGKPLYEYLGAESRTALAPLIRRIETLAGKRSDVH